MAKESSESSDGIPSFEYSPASEQQPLLFQYNRTLDDLEGLLLKDLAGKTMSMKEIYEQHNIGTLFVRMNYKEALRRLEAKGKINTDPPACNETVRTGYST